MKILVVSDTHQITYDFERILEQYANEVKLVCHLGDHAMDLLKFQSRYPQLNMVGVAGNCDYSVTEQERLLEFTPCADSDLGVIKRILLTHGHNLGVKMGMDRIASYARGKGAGACFFGHTHCPVMQTHGGVFFLNPGSPSIPREGSKASYGLVEILPTGVIEGRIIKI